MLRKLANAPCDGDMTGMLAQVASPALRRRQLGQRARRVAEIPPEGEKKVPVAGQAMLPRSS